MLDPLHITSSIAQTGAADNSLGLSICGDKSQLTSTRVDEFVTMAGQASNKNGAGLMACTGPTPLGSVSCTSHLAPAFQRAPQRHRIGIFQIAAYWQASRQPGDAYAQRLD